MALGSSEAKSSKVCKALKEKVIRKEKLVLLLKDLLQVKDKNSHDSIGQQVLALRSKGLETCLDLKENLHQSCAAGNRAFQQQDSFIEQIEDQRISLIDKDGMVSHLTFQNNQLVEAKRQDEKTIEKLKERIKSLEKKSNFCNCTFKSKKRKSKDRIEEDAQSNLLDPKGFLNSNLLTEGILTPASSVSSNLVVGDPSNLLTEGILTPASSVASNLVVGDPSSPAIGWLDLDSRSNSPSLASPVDSTDISDPIPPLLDPIQPSNDDISSHNGGSLPLLEETDEDQSQKQNDNCAVAESLHTAPGSGRGIHLTAPSNSTTQQIDCPLDSLPSEQFPEPIKEAGKSAFNSNCSTQKLDAAAPEPQLMNTVSIFDVPDDKVMSVSEFCSNEEVKDNQKNISSETKSRQVADLNLSSGQCSESLLHDDLDLSDVELDLESTESSVPMKNINVTKKEIPIDTYVSEGQDEAVIAHSSCSNEVDQSSIDCSDGPSGMSILASDDVEMSSCRPNNFDKDTSTETILPTSESVVDSHVVSCSRNGLSILDESSLNSVKPNQSRCDSNVETTALCSSDRNTEDLSTVGTLEQKNSENQPKLQFNEVVDMNFSGDKCTESALHNDFDLSATFDVESGLEQTQCGQGDHLAITSSPTCEDKGKHFNWPNDGDASCESALQVSELTGCTPVVSPVPSLNFQKLNEPRCNEMVEPFGQSLHIFNSENQAAVAKDSTLETTSHNNEVAAVDLPSGKSSESLIRNDLDLSLTFDSDSDLESTHCSILLNEKLKNANGADQQGRDLASQVATGENALLEKVDPQADGQANTCGSSPVSEDIGVNYDDVEAETITDTDVIGGCSALEKSTVSASITPSRDVYGSHFVSKTHLDESDTIYERQGVSDVDDDCSQSSPDCSDHSDGESENIKTHSNCEDTAASIIPTAPMCNESPLTKLECNDDCSQSSPDCSDHSDGESENIKTHSNCEDTAVSIIPTAPMCNESPLTQLECNDDCSQSSPDCSDHSDGESENIKTHSNCEDTAASIIPTAPMCNESRLTQLECNVKCEDLSVNQSSALLPPEVVANRDSENSSDEDRLRSEMSTSAGSQYQSPTPTPSADQGTSGCVIHAQNTLESSNESKSGTDPLLDNEKDVRSSSCSTEHSKVEVDQIESRTSSPKLTPSKRTRKKKRENLETKESCPVISPRVTRRSKALEEAKCSSNQKRSSISHSNNDTRNLRSGKKRVLPDRKAKRKSSLSTDDEKPERRIITRQAKREKSLSSDDEMPVEKIMTRQSKRKTSLSTDDDMPVGKIMTRRGKCRSPVSTDDETPVGKNMTRQAKRGLVISSDEDIPIAEIMTRHRKTLNEDRSAASRKHPSRRSRSKTRSPSYLPHSNEALIPKENAKRQILVVSPDRSDAAISSDSAKFKNLSETSTAEHCEPKHNNRSSQSPEPFSLPEVHIEESLVPTETSTSIPSRVGSQSIRSHSPDFAGFNNLTSSNSFLEHLKLKVLHNRRNSRESLTVEEPTQNVADQLGICFQDIQLKSSMVSANQALVPSPENLACSESRLENLDGIEDHRTSSEPSTVEEHYSSNAGVCLQNGHLKSSTVSTNAVLVPTADSLACMESRLEDHHVTENQKNSCESSTVEESINTATNRSGVCLQDGQLKSSMVSTNPVLVSPADSLSCIENRMEDLNVIDDQRTFSESSTAEKAINNTSDQIGVCLLDDQLKSPRTSNNPVFVPTMENCGLFQANTNLTSSLHSSSQVNDLHLFNSQSYLTFSDLKPKNNLRTIPRDNPDDDEDASCTNRPRMLTGFGNYSSGGCGVTASVSDVDDLLMGQLCWSLRLLSMDSSSGNNHFVHFSTSEVKKDPPPSYWRSSQSRSSRSHPTLKGDDRWTSYRDSFGILNDSLDPKSGVTIEIKQEDTPFSLKLSVPRGGKSIEPVLDTLCNMVCGVKPSNETAQRDERCFNSDHRNSFKEHNTSSKDYHSDNYSQPPSSGLFDPLQSSSFQTRRTHLFTEPQSHKRYRTLSNLYNVEDETSSSCSVPRSQFNIAKTWPNQPQLSSERPFLVPDDPVIDNPWHMNARTERNVNSSQDNVRSRLLNPQFGSFRNPGNQDNIFKRPMERTSDPSKLRVSFNQKDDEPRFSSGRNPFTNSHKEPIHIQKEVSKHTSEVRSGSFHLKQPSIHPSSLHTGKSVSKVVPSSDSESNQLTDTVDDPLDLTTKPVKRPKTPNSTNLNTVTKFSTCASNEFNLSTGEITHKEAISSPEKTSSSSSERQKPASGLSCVEPSNLKKKEENPPCISSSSVESPKGNESHSLTIEDEESVPMSKKKRIAHSPQKKPSAPIINHLDAVEGLKTTASDGLTPLKEAFLPPKLSSISYQAQAPGPRLPSKVHLPHTPIKSVDTSNSFSKLNSPITIRSDALTSEDDEPALKKKRFAYSPEERLNQPLSISSVAQAPASKLSPMEYPARSTDSIKYSAKHESPTINQSHPLTSEEDEPVPAHEKKRFADSLQKKLSIHNKDSGDSVKGVHTNALDESSPGCEIGKPRTPPKEALLPLKKLSIPEFGLSPLECPPRAPPRPVDISKSADFKPLSRNQSDLSTIEDDELVPVSRKRRVAHSPVKKQSALIKPSNYSSGLKKPQIPLRQSPRKHSKTPPKEDKGEDASNSRILRSSKISPTPTEGVQNKSKKDSEVISVEQDTVERNVVKTESVDSKSNRTATRGNQERALCIGEKQVPNVMINCTTCHEKSELCFCSYDEIVAYWYHPTLLTPLPASPKPVELPNMDVEDDNKLSQLGQDSFSETQATLDTKLNVTSNLEQLNPSLSVAGDHGGLEDDKEVINCRRTRSSLKNGAKYKQINTEKKSRWDIKSKVDVTSANSEVEEGLKSPQGVASAINCHTAENDRRLSEKCPPSYPEACQANLDDRILALNPIEDEEEVPKFEDNFEKTSNPLKGRTDPMEKASNDCLKSNSNEIVRMRSSDRKKGDDSTEHTMINDTSQNSSLCEIDDDNTSNIDGFGLEASKKEEALSLNDTMKPPPPPKPVNSVIAKGPVVSTSCLSSIETKSHEKFVDKLLDSIGVKSNTAPVVLEKESSEITVQRNPTNTLLHIGKFFEKKILSYSDHIQDSSGRVEEFQEMEGAKTSKPVEPTNAFSAGTGVVSYESDVDSESGMIIDYSSDSDRGSIAAELRKGGNKFSGSPLTAEVRSAHLALYGIHEGISKSSFDSPLSLNPPLPVFYRSNEEVDSVPAEVNTGHLASRSVHEGNGERPIEATAPQKFEMPAFYKSVELVEADTHEVVETQKIINISSDCKVFSKSIKEEEIIHCTTNLFEFSSSYDAKDPDAVAIRPDHGPDHKTSEKISNCLNEYFSQSNCQESLKKANATLRGVKAAHIARILCDMLGNSKDKAIPSERGGVAKFYSTTQKKAVLLALDLSRDNFEHLNTILSYTEECLIPSPLSASHNNMSRDINACVNLATFYGVLCRSQGFGFRVQSFIYDLLFGRHINAFKIINILLGIIPQAIPFAKEIMGPLTYTILYLIMKQGIYKNMTDKALLSYSVTPLRSKLQQKYHYSFPSDLTRELVIDELMNHVMTIGGDKAIILLCKSQGFRFAYGVAQKHFFPILNDWMNCKRKDEDLVARVIRILGLVSRGFAASICENFVVTSMAILKRITLHEPGLIITEAVVECLLHFKRLDGPGVKEILSTWTPHDYRVTESCVINVKRIIGNKHRLRSGIKT